MSIAAMLIVGTIVSSLIEEAVTRNSAASTALYVDSVIAPLLPDMQNAEPLGETESRALDETLGHGALGSRLLSFKLWRRDGTILYSNDSDLTGSRFELSENLRSAFTGRLAAEFDDAGGVESLDETGHRLPLLKIYNPLLQPWSGEVVAVLEFYELAAEFEEGLRLARLYSWLAVAGVTSGFFLALSLVVYRGSRTIEWQSLVLKRRVAELSRLLDSNRELHKRVQVASRRATALNESYLRRIGADLHDGPAQLIALAALRLDSCTPLWNDTCSQDRTREILAIRSHLDEAMGEIRSLCSGLVLPQIETSDLRDILERAIRNHESRTGTTVELSLSGAPETLTPSEKICIYRFVQEALTNSYKHAGGKGQAVAQVFENGRLCLEVADTGPGFDPDSVRPENLGLAALRDRVESLGGSFQIESSSEGTCVRMFLQVLLAEEE